MNLLSKQQELQEKLSNQVITEEDKAEIEKEVNEYREALLDKKQNAYNDNIKVIEAKLDLIEELLYEEADEEEEQESAEEVTQEVNEA